MLTLYRPRRATDRPTNVSAVALLSMVSLVALATGCAGAPSNTPAAAAGSSTTVQSSGTTSPGASTSRATSTACPTGTVISDPRGPDGGQVLVARPSGPAKGVLLQLHRLGADASSFDSWTRLSATAPEAGWIVVTPNGVPSPTDRMFWNPSDATFTERNADALVAVVIAVASSACAGPLPVAIAGYSNGGGMTAILACDERLDVRVVVMAAREMPPGERCAERPLAVLLLHGNADPLIPSDGGSASMPHVAGAGWAAHLRCGPSRTEPVQGAVRTVFDGCPAGTTVESFDITEGGHTWPGGRDQGAGFGPVSRDIDATARTLALLGSVSG